MVKSPFVDLLAQTEASLPTSDADITAFLAVHQTKYASGTTSAAAIKRQESAACVLWLQTLSPEDEGGVTTVESLPISLKKAIVTTFVLKQNPSTDGWSKLAIRRAHAHMAGGSSTVKKKRPEADGSDGAMETAKGPRIAIRTPIAGAAGPAPGTGSTTGGAVELGDDGDVEAVGEVDEDEGGLPARAGGEEEDVAERRAQKE